MSLLLIAQILFNVITTLIIFILWARLKRPPQEDPRMSRGLQLLQSKIAIMENLSDKSEEQFKNINNLIEKKTENLQKFVIRSEEQVTRLETSMKKSKEIAKIFQDKIPHDEIIERKKSMQLITAARLANEGVSVEEIVDKVKLPRAQVEMITKVNKDQLIFDNKNLPDWVKKMEDKEAKESEQVLELGNSLESKVKHSSEVWLTTATDDIFDNGNLLDSDQVQRMQQMGDDFKVLCTNYEQRQRQLDYEIENNLTQKMFDGAEKASQVMAKNITDAGQVIAQNVGEVSQSVAKNVGEVSQQVAKNVGKNVGHVSGKVKVRAADVSQQVYSHVTEVKKRVVHNANAVGNKIVEKTGSVIDPKAKNTKTKIKKVLFQKVESDKDMY